MDQGIKSGPYSPGGMRAKNRNDRMQEQKNEGGKEAPEAVHTFSATHAFPSQTPNPGWLPSAIWLDPVPGPWSFQVLRSFLAGEESPSLQELQL